MTAGNGRGRRQTETTGSVGWVRQASGLRRFTAAGAVCLGAVKALILFVVSNFFKSFFFIQLLNTLKTGVHAAATRTARGCLRDLIALVNSSALRAE